MPEAVIVATARSPIGRANKGSLKDLRPDDMSAQIVKALMAKVPQVKGDDVEDLIMGIGQPAGEGGFNIGRMVAILAGLDNAYVYLDFVTGEHLRDVVALVLVVDNVCGLHGVLEDSLGMWTI